MELEATLQWADIVTRLAAAHTIEPAVVLAMIYVESRGNAIAVNETSLATGLMQVMPREASPMFCHRPASEELLDPELNIGWGLKILNHHLSSKQTLWAALYHYSGGKSWPSESDFTRTYWLPFAEAWAEIAASLKEQEQSG